MTVRTKQTEVRAWLLVTGFECEAPEISRLLGLTPTKTWRRGERVLAIASNLHHENGWRLDAPLETVDSTVNDQVESLLTVVLPQRDKFPLLPPGTTIVIECSLFSYAHRPIISFSREAVQGVAALRCPLAVDVYDLSAE